MDKEKSNIEFIDVRDSSECETPDRRPSPFSYHQGMTTEFEHYSKKGFEKIATLLEKKLINADARAILSLFESYRYLNSYLCWAAFENQVRETEETMIKNRLSELFRLGLVIRFRLKYSDSSGKRRASSYIYCLSEKGNKLYNSGPYMRPDITDVLRQLAFNQYFLSMSHEYNNLYTHRYCYSPNGTESDGLLVFPSAGKNLSFNIITVRTDPNWKVRLMKALDAFTDDKNAAFIILAESEISVLEINAFIRKDERFLNHVILYMCDYATFDRGLLLKNLIMVNNNETGAYSTVSLIIDH